MRRLFRKNKYNAVRTEYNGRIYASKKEAAYAARLDWSKRGTAFTTMTNAVYEWWPQVPFVFPCGTKIIVDFKILYRDGHVEYIEIKGGKATRTRAYMIKRKMLLHHFGIDLKEV